MSPPSVPLNQRRAPRKRASGNAIVTDVIRGEPIGHLGNLSSSGMLLIASQAPRSEALYQVSIALPPTGCALVQSQPIEVGIQEQWHEHAASSGQIWAGYRIIAITDIDAARLESWLAQA
ncbi:MAG: PilZ domain-containing protein [Rhodanobacter sp.]|nr:MAG: PilZ domain-containing protein [Rhodanobacter sp.]TAL89541.1 MAG: PilZ domain-containing protein [Rhodanobacter sp.]TAM41910.1 MAG: PilZ domain-containing protein [Rhodanobacter sp.]TAN29199.1 MAG: PilZ domain-containing protein [Rhodanobacter sp.]